MENEVDQTLEQFLEFMHGVSDIDNCEGIEMVTTPTGVLDQMDAVKGTDFVPVTYKCEDGDVVTRFFDRQGDLTHDWDIEQVASVVAEFMDGIHDVKTSREFGEGEDGEVHEVMTFSVEGPYATITMVYAPDDA